MSFGIEELIDFEPSPTERLLDRYILEMGGEGVICPFCGHHIADDWQSLYQWVREGSGQGVITTELPEGSFLEIHVEWMRCQNSLCQQLLVRIIKEVDRDRSNREWWFAVPKIKHPPPLPPSIPEQMARDFCEAWMILDDSWRMSAVLSRRILADLLEEHTDSAVKDRSLPALINEFMDGPHPARITENLHYLREMGNISAHTVSDPVGSVVEVTKEEAEWSLTVVWDLLDYFIIAPEEARRRRAEMDAKLEKAGRKAIRRTSPEEEEEGGT